MLKYIYDVSGNLLSRALENVLLPQITGQPVRQVAAPGDSVTFSVVVDDARQVTFQWKFNGTDIPGATGDSILLANVNAANQGQYSVVVTNNAGSVTSAPVALMLDSDDDGLPDTWEQANFTDPNPTHPLNPANQRSETDPDKDGIANLDEFLDGTNPVNKRSLRPRLIVYSGAGGSVTVTPMKRSYDLGELVTLTAQPSSANGIVRWEGDINSNDNSVTIKMDSNKTVRAKFVFAVPMPLGLIALWRGETDASDLIDGHHGTFYADTTLIIPSITDAGKIGGAFDFDGTMHVRVPDSPALKPAQLTVEAWVFPTGSGFSFQAILARGSATNENNTWYMGLFNGKPQFWSHDNHLLEGSFAIPRDEWTHLAITFDGTTKRLYVNGVEVNSRSGLGALVYYAASVPVTIGSDWANNSSNARFNGRIDELALYSCALTADEIFGIYHADFAGKNFSQLYFTSPAQLPDVPLEAVYTHQLRTILGTAPVNFLLSAGALPPGMALSSTGLISGVSSAAGIFVFTVLATDAAGLSVEQQFVLRVLQPVAQPADLVAWWRGEPAIGNVVSDTIGGHDGSFFSGLAAVAPAFTAEGKVGSAFTFNGTLYIQIPDAVELRPSQITLEAWVFPTLLSNDHQTVIAHGSSTNDNDTWYLGLFNGRPRFWSHGANLLEGPSPIPLNEWTHLAVTFDGTTKRLYVDGLQVGVQAILSALVYDAAPVPVTIGADWAFNTPIALFNGRIDEVSLYRRALSATEIFSLVDAGSAGKRII
jgi:hypothetical protein